MINYNCSKDKETRRMIKLYAKIQDREAGFERVVLCQFLDKDGNNVFVEEVEKYNELCFKVVLDEGYVRTEYFYPVRRYSITELEVYE